MYTTIIFDLDGTLIDSDYHNMSSLQFAVNSLEGTNYTLDEMKKMSGMPAPAIMQALNIQHVDEVMEEWDAAFFRQSGRSEYFDGIADTLAELKRRGVYVGIVTSRERHEYDAFFSHLELYENYDLVIFASDTKNHKPHPEPILKFLELSGKPKAGALYIGDTVYDRDTALGAGIGFALAGWSLHDVPCEMVLKKPQDILDIVPNKK